MVTRPTDFIEPFAQAGANGFTFHYESEYADIKQVCEAIRTKNMKVGLAIKPNTPLDQTIRQLIRESFVDMILIMTVEPGFGGQLFNQDVMPKVKSLRE
jgi:ribulose-phosphate 3-epimerase